MHFNLTIIGKLFSRGESPPSAGGAAVVLAVNSGSFSGSILLKSFSLSSWLIERSDESIVVLILPWKRLLIVWRLTLDVGDLDALCLLEPWSFFLACLRSIRMTTLVPDSPGVRQKSPQAGCILSKVQTRAVQWRSEKYFESRTLRTVLSWHDLYQDCIKPCWVGKKGKLSCCVRAPGPLASHCQRTAYVCNTVCFIYQYLFSIRLLVLQENK